MSSNVERDGVGLLVVVVDLPAVVDELEGLELPRPVRVGRDAVQIRTPWVGPEEDRLRLLALHGAELHALDDDLAAPGGRNDELADAVDVAALDDVDAPGREDAAGPVAVDRHVLQRQETRNVVAAADAGCRRPPLAGSLPMNCVLRR